ncbi:MAG: hypothetical protein LBC93_00450 [Synergistaceae bacterium]|nr:hypothetical protein [Synergistaceae bacterium]
MEQAWRDYKTSVLNGIQFEQRLAALLTELQNSEMYKEALELLDSTEIKSNLPEAKISNDRITILDRSRQNDVLLIELLLKRAKKSRSDSNASACIHDMMKAGRLYQDSEQYDKAIKQYQECQQDLQRFRKVLGDERFQTLETDLNRVKAVCYSHAGMKDEALQAAELVLRIKPNDVNMRGIVYPDNSANPECPTDRGTNSDESGGARRPSPAAPDSSAAASSGSTLPDPQKGVTTLEELLRGTSVGGTFVEMRSAQTEKNTAARPVLKTKATTPENEPEITPQPCEAWDAENPPLESAASKDMAKDMLEGRVEIGFDAVRKLVHLLLEEASAASITGSTLPAAFARAVVLAKSFTLEKNVSALEHDAYEKLYAQLLLATDAPLDPRDYSDTVISKVFYEDDEDDLCTPLYVSSLLRVFFMPSEGYNYGLTTGPDDPVMEYVNAFSGSLGLIFDALFKMRKPNGFSASLLMQICDGAERQNREEQLADNAKSLKHVPAYGGYSNASPFFAACFGDTSPLGKSMDIIAVCDTKSAEFVQANHKDISGDKDKFIKTVWNQAINAKRVKSRQAEGRLLDQVKTHVQKRLDVMKAWLDLNANAAAMPDDDTIERLIAVKENILTLIPKALEETEESRLAGKSLVIYMLRRVRETLEKGTLPLNPYAFADILRTCFIELELNGIPQLGRSDDVDGFESWRNALEHIAAPQFTLAEVLKRAADVNDKSYYDNIGSAMLIERMGAPAGAMKWEKFKLNAEKVAREDQKRFRADMVIARHDGCINEAFEQRILKIEEEFYRELWRNSNFAHYRIFLDVLRRQAEGETKHTVEGLKERLDSLEGVHDEQKEDYATILQKLENRKCLTAEEYINCWEAGERLVTIEETLNENDAFSDFLHVYDEIRELCLKNKEVSYIAKWGYKVVVNMIDANNKVLSGTSGENVGKRNLTSVQELLQSWPEKKSTVTNVILVNLFKNLGFKAEEAECLKMEHDISNGVIFKLKIKPAPKGLPDYPYPIAQFGTEASAFFIVCLFGGVHPTQIVDNIRKLNLGSNTIVLLNSASMTQKNRRKLADLSRGESQLNAFLLVDQTLLLYLATLDISVRLSALLKCTLPYTFYQPFSEGFGYIADEMFFGRREELKRILDPRGASLVYGGRQLGKSALMEQAKSRANNPNDGDYAVLVSVKRENTAGALQAIVDKMKKEARLFDEHEPCETWGGLFSALRNLFNGEKNIAHLLLLVDEADAFLEDDQNSGYRILDELNKLKNETSNRFKFVFAGLHHVARTSAAIINNGIGPHIGDALCIKPLSPPDARNLLMRPLLYLGFHMDSDKINTILTHANYYPGTLQLVGNTLVRKVSERYAEYYSADGGNPPCNIQDDVLSNILASQEISMRIKNMLDITLKADENRRYEILAYLLAYLYYESEENGAIAEGYSLKNITNAASDWEITGKITSANSIELEFETLLDEMVEMGVLWKSARSNHTSVVYRLRRNNFLANIGYRESVWDWLSSASGNV